MNLLNIIFFHSQVFEYDNQAILDLTSHIFCQVKEHLSFDVRLLTDQTGGGLEL